MATKLRPRPAPGKSSGARRQREAFRAGGVRAVVRTAIEATHSTASPAA
jgi:hypothetical protein